MNQDGVGLMRLDLSPLEYAVAPLEDGLVHFNSAAYIVLTASGR